MKIRCEQEYELFFHTVRLSAERVSATEYCFQSDLLPARAGQIDAAVFRKRTPSTSSIGRYSVNEVQFCLLTTRWQGSPGGSRCQRMSHAAGISRHADQPGDLSVGRYAPCGNLRHDRIDFRVRSFGKGHVGGVLEFALLEALGVFRFDQMVDAVLDVAVHEGRQVVDRCS